VIRTYKVQRYRNTPEAGGQTLFFGIDLGSRRRGHKWFNPGQVPEFEGDEAWFEIDRQRGGRKFVRQVEQPSWAR
jgi:hypothetical protein